VALLNRAAILRPAHASAPVRGKIPCSRDSNFLFLLGEFAVLKNRDFCCKPLSRRWNLAEKRTTSTQIEHFPVNFPVRASADTAFQTTRHAPRPAGRRKAGTRHTKRKIRATPTPGPKRIPFGARLGIRDLTELAFAAGALETRGDGPDRDAFWIVLAIIDRG